MKTRIAAAVGLLTILVAALAYGQDHGIPTLVNIPFKFSVGKKEMPAGKYLFVPDPEVGSLILRNKDNGKAMYVRIRERLAHVSSSEKPSVRVVFDTVGDQKFLSEFWPATNDDGYLLGVTKKEQKHLVLSQ
ncbi:MAG: hypothetical protein LAP13_10180 [Acidobacteriia bacterium]|nr:hypothetical protein [Terriglobia bacterium]